MLLRWLKEIARSPLDILKNLYLYRHILGQMVVREIKGRFAGSMGGLFWHFVHPILMMVIFLFVFVYIFKLRVGAGTGSSAIYLLAGLFPWIIMAEGLSRGTSSLIENANLIQKTSFPIEILTTKAVVAPLLSYGIAIVLLMLYKVIAYGSAGMLFVLPLVMALQILFTMGVVFLSSTLSVFFRDVLQLMSLVISFWIYLTPILYPMTLLPEWARRVMYLNPLYPFMANYQSLLLRGSLEDWHLVLVAALWAFGFFTAGSFVFNKLKYEFADWL
jgi:ABC-type polysaccharide/polyol phosphate export permease